VQPWYTLAGTFVAAQDNLPQRTTDTTKLAEPWWNLGKTLVERSAELFGGPKRTEPQRVRKQFYPETFTMAENPKAIAVGEK